MNVSPEYLDAVCEGCLSLDRQQTAEVTDLTIKKVFYEILNVVENIDSLTLRLCVECKANIVKYLAFKKQVIHAHGTLNNYLLKSSQNALANVSTHAVVLHQPDSTEVKEYPPLIKIDNEPRLHVPLAFIKIEDNADDVDEYFVDDGYGQDEVDDKEFTAVLNNSDLIKPNQLKLRARSKKSREDDFNDSDEEPLTSKKKTDSGRLKRDKKRKKKNDVTPKMDRRKFPAPKKEKPAGVVNNPRVKKKLQQLNVEQGQLEMVVLSWEEVEAERQKALSSIMFTRHEYRCYDCVLGFNHKFKLTNHMKKHDPCAGEFACGVCKVRCKDAHSLCAHRRRHRVRWRCCECGATCSRAAVAADHAARLHRAPAPTHACRHCGHCEPSLAKLRNHMKNHGERQKCELCGKSFRDRTSLRTHLFIHKGEKEYSCPRCEKRFLFKKAMEVHLVTHDAPAHLYCYECDLNFKNRMSYAQHIKYSLKHVDPAMLKYACELCDKKFMKASRLQEHKLAVHLKATPIACSAPGCSFTKKTLEGHLRSHTGERPFQCTQCPSTFGYEAALYNHNKLVHLKAKLGRSRPPQLPPHLPPSSSDIPQIT